MDQKLDRITERFRELEQEMSRPEVITDQNRFKALTRERSQLAPIVNTYEEYRKCRQELVDSESIVGDEKDPEMKDLLVSEIAELKKRKEEYEAKVSSCSSQGPNSGKDVIMEIGQELAGRRPSLRPISSAWRRNADIGLKIEYERELHRHRRYKEMIFCRVRCATT